MITFVEGILVEKAPARAVLNVQGVGYEVFISLNSFDRLPNEGEKLRLLTYHHVREDIQALYGFTSEEERRLFIMLLGVSGIGPKLALSALSGLTVREFKAAIAGSDIKRLSSISGIGKKTAERLVVELRDALGKGESLEALAAGKAPESRDVRSRDAILALISLGYKQAEAQAMIAKAAPRLDTAGTVEDLVRLALTQ